MSGQGQPSRYTRSFSGMTGALIVTVLAVLAFVAWRGLFRSDVDDTPEAVDWQESVELAEQADLRVVHPRELPAGWTATSVDLVAGDDPRWGLGVLTDDGRLRRHPPAGHVGRRPRRAVRRREGRGRRRRHRDLRRSPTPGRPGPTTAATTGYSTEVGDEAVLVYGSAPVEDLEAYLGAR